MANLKLPNGTLGLIVSSTNEAQQEDLFFPCEPRLFAVNVAGDPECGTLVFDLNKANEPDSARGAYLQSAFRVVKLPLGQPNAIAFQLDLTGKKDTQGGFFCEIMQAPAAKMGAGDTSKPGQTVVQGAVPPMPENGGFGFGEGSHNFGGPFHVGVADDKHKHGEDADGNPINALHIWTDANFFMNRFADGKIRFELEYKEGDERDFIVPAHLAWTGADWAIWTSTDFYKPGGRRIVPEQPIRPLDPTFPNFDFAPFQPLPGIPSNEIFNTPVNTVFDGVIDGRVTGSGIIPNMVATLSALMAPAMVFRPENYNTATQSTGLFDSGSSAGGFSQDEGGTPSGFGTDQTQSAANADKADKSSPITCMVSAFGAQGGFVDAGGSGSGTTTGGEGDPWVYTQIPRGTKEVGRKTSLYPGGTASGGIIYHPPETDLRDIDSGMVPDNVTLSETRIMCAPGASFGVGIPNLETGSIKTGANWSYDSSTGDVVWHTYSFTTESEALRLTNPTQLIRWMSGQSFYGEFSHTNTANRTWTFPDVTSTISSILFDTVAPTATATEGTLGWDTVANNLYVNNDGATGWTFVGGASSVTGSGAAGRVAIWSSATALTSDADLTFSGSTTTATNLIVTTGLTNSALTAGRVTFASTAGLLADDAGLTYAAACDALTVAGFAKVGTATDAAAAGEFSAGITASGRMHFRRRGPGDGYINDTEAAVLNTGRLTIYGAATNDNIDITYYAPGLPDASASFGFQNANGALEFHGEKGTSGRSAVFSMQTDSSGYINCQVRNIADSDGLNLAFDSVLGPAINVEVNAFIDFGAGGALNRYARLNATGLFQTSTRAFGWTNGAVTGTVDAQFVRDAAGVIAQKNSTTAQAFRVYGTTTGSKYIQVEHTGSDGYVLPSAGSLFLGDAGTPRWRIYDSDGSFVAVSDNAYKIGFSGSNRPSSIYLGTGVFIQSNTGTLSFGTSDDVVLTRDAAAILALKNGTNAQTLRVYGTTTSSKYVYLNHDGSNAQIDVSSGAGVLLMGGNASVLRAVSSLDSYTDDGFDVGGASNRFRTGRFGTSVIIGSTTHTITATGVVFNETGIDQDFRIESDDESYCLMVEGTLNNVVLCANAEPGFNSMDGGVFLAEANVVPSGNPTAGIYIYVESGAGKARGTGGTVTTWAPAEPHCEVCGTDYGHEWENTRWGRLQFCVNCLADDVAAKNGGVLPKWIKRESA